MQNQTPTDRTKKLCPSHDGGSNFWSASYSQKTKLLYIPTRSTCDEISLTQDIRKNANGIINGASRKYIARNETDLVVADPFTGEVKKKLHVPYPDNSAALTTAGGLLITASPTERSPPTTTPASISSGISTSAAASMRLR